jgi:hypothetical protein
MSNNTFNNDLTVARKAMESLNLKGLRPQAVRAFLEATTDDQREDAVAEWGAGMVRRGLRQIAQRFDRKQDEETADVFWALRDDIDEETGDVFRVEAAEVA